MARAGVGQGLSDGRGAEELSGTVGLRKRGYAHTGDRRSAPRFSLTASVSGGTRGAGLTPQ